MVCSIPVTEFNITNVLHIFFLSKTDCFYMLSKSVYGCVCLWTCKPSYGPNGSDLFVSPFLWYTDGFFFLKTLVKIRCNDVIYVYHCHFFDFPSLLKHSFIWHMVSCRADQFQSCSVSENLELLIQLPFSPKCWDHRHMLPCLVYIGSSNPGLPAL